MTDAFEMQEILDLIHIKPFVEKINSDLFSCYKKAKEDPLLNIYGYFIPEDENAEKSAKTQLEGIFVLQKKGIENEKKAEISHLLVKHPHVDQNRKEIISRVLTWLNNQAYQEVLFIAENASLFENVIEDLKLDEFDLTALNHTLDNMNEIKELLTVNDDFKLISLQEFIQIHSQNHLELISSFIYTNITATDEDTRKILCNMTTLKKTETFISSLFNDEKGDLLKKQSLVALKGDQLVGISFVASDDEAIIVPLTVIADTHYKTLLFEKIMAKTIKNAQKLNLAEVFLALVAINPSFTDRALALGFKQANRVVIYTKQL